MNSETEKYLSQLEQLANEASEGPWDFGDGESDCWNSFQSVYDKNLNVICLDTHSKEDAAFIAAAREAIPRLIGMVRELDAEADLLADDLAYEGDYCPLDTDQYPKVPCTQEQRGKCWRIAVKQWIEDDDVEEENARSDNV